MSDPTKPKTKKQKAAAGKASMRHREKLKSGGIPTTGTIQRVLLSVLLGRMFSPAGLRATRADEDNLIDAAMRKGGWDPERGDIRSAVARHVSRYRPTTSAKQSVADILSGTDERYKSTLTSEAS